MLLRNYNAGLFTYFGVSAVRTSFPTRGHNVPTFGIQSFPRSIYYREYTDRYTEHR